MNFFQNNFHNNYNNNVYSNNYNLNNFPNFNPNQINFNNHMMNNNNMMNFNHNMIYNNGMNYNNMMMNNLQALAMYNNMCANQNIALMNQLKMQKRQMAINKILNEPQNNKKIYNEINNANNNNGNNTNNSNDNQNVNNQRKQALEDVSQETQIQLQNKANLLNQNQPNNYEEIDPTFMHSFISDKQLFDGNGHKIIENWAHGENRGGRVYNPPNGWIGFGLNVLGKYDNGNNDWLSCNGRPGEWCVAYHGACVRNTSDEIKQIIKPILENNLKPGGGQAYSGYDDAMHPGQKVGVGVYCSPNPATMDGYAGTIEVNGYKYKVAFMLRVKPDKIRYSNSQPDYWVLNAGNGDFSELRPYRFLIKKTN